MSPKNCNNKMHRMNRLELNKACADGDLGGVKKLVAAVKNLNRVIDGDTPLTSASRWAHVEVAAFLVANGADVNYEGSDDSALHCAIRSRDRDMVRLLLEAGANPNAYCKTFGQPALELALCMQRADIATELLNFGASIELSSPDGPPMSQLLGCGGDELLGAVCRKPKWFSVTMPDGFPLLHSLRTSKRKPLSESRSTSYST